MKAFFFCAIACSLAACITIPVDIGSASALVCGGADAGVPAFTEVAAFDKCVTCHDSAKSGAARAGAPANINYDNYTAASQSAASAAKEVAQGTMPPAASGLTLSDADKNALYLWAACGTPQ